MRVWELTTAKGGAKMLDSSLGLSADPRASPLAAQKEVAYRGYPPDSEL